MAEQLLNARYRVLRPLGTGGMASVYLAEDLRLGRRVAVKILHPQFAADPTFVARFEQEARLAASLSHPNIVRVYDVGHDGDRHYIVMEYVEGETLKDTIARQGALPVTRALEIIGGVLAALDVAHTHNLIHRDIKAQNILITPDGDVKVADFGIARELGGLSAPTLTATGMVMGTAQYFAPEQAQGRPATPQSDVYAAGIVLFEMLTGQLPFDGENPLGVAMQQINQPPPLPSSINRTIPPAVEAIALKALAKNPAERYASAAEMKAAADAARSGAAEPHPPGPTCRPSDADHRRRPVPPPGVIRQTTRPTPVVATAAPTPATGRTTQRLLWIVAAALVALAAFAAARYIANGSLRLRRSDRHTDRDGYSQSLRDAHRGAVAHPSPLIVPPATATRPAPTATARAPSATSTSPSPHRDRRAATTDRYTRVRPTHRCPRRPIRLRRRQHRRRPTHRRPRLQRRRRRPRRLDR